MRRKRLASLALAAVMTASVVLAGCGQGETTQAPASSGTEPAAAGTESGTEAGTEAAASQGAAPVAVSYTHLDVYKRQGKGEPSGGKPLP